jgi:hypothetical protein
LITATATIVAALISISAVQRYTDVEVPVVSEVISGFVREPEPPVQPPVNPIMTPTPPDDEDGETLPPSEEPTTSACDVTGEPAVASERVVISNDGVNLRAGPGTDCDVVSFLNAGTEGSVIGGSVEDASGTAWVKVRIDDTGEEGWVSAEYLESASQVAVTDTPTPEPRPDLAVAAVDVLPREPVQGIAYTYNVYGANFGTVHTGEFSYHVIVVDLTSGATYPDIWRTHTGLYPGESYSVEYFDDAYANCSGPHEVRVEFTVPEGDADPGNNALVQPFTVQPNLDIPPCT